MTILSTPVVDELEVVAGGGGGATKSPVGTLPARVVTEITHVRATAITKRFILGSPLDLRMQGYLYQKWHVADRRLLAGTCQRGYIAARKGSFYSPKKVYLLKLASPKFDTSHLTPNAEALSRCETALELKHKADHEGALQVMRPLWRGVGHRPDTKGLLPGVAAEVFLCTGILTGWIGSRNQIKGAQEIAKNLITESISYYETESDAKKVAEARTEIAYCYWRDGELNEARIMLLEALERLTTAGITRARALLKLSIVEQSAARYYEALKILTDNTSLFAKVTHHATKGDYHNELAMTLEEIAEAEKRDEYFQRALTEYKAAEHHFKLAKNHPFRASVKNNVGVVLLKLGRFKEAHKQIAAARRLSVRFKDRTRTAQFDITRAEVLIAERKFKAAEVVAHKAALALEKGGQRCLETDALITQGIALARLGKTDRAHSVLQRAIKVAHEVDALNKAGLAALTVIEELDQLTPTILQAAYQQARDWLAGTQSQEVLVRLNEAAGKLAASLRGELSTDEALAVLLTKPGDLQKKLLKYEHELIKQALAQSDGAVTHAADLLGMTYQGLAYIIETRHRDLLKARTPIRRRPRKLSQIPTKKP
ncbi:MAG TPA: helix-turn-helix domain-containing protein [Pyrinomonadaceae bacterium]|nr:helix-turn-helix domain-containing protein [Pyrinomonadaceae bacterium]